MEVVGYRSLARREPAPTPRITSCCRDACCKAPRAGARLAVMVGVKGARCSFKMALLGLGVVVGALLACKQGSDEKGEKEPAKAEPEAVTECKSGDVAACTCADGASGSRDCTAGKWTSCACKPPEPAKPDATEQPAAPTGQVLAADGLPEEIPRPSSTPPTVEEWNALPKECTVKASSPLKCNTWMIREWLKVNCHENALGKPVSLDTSGAGGVQSFKFVRPSTQTSVVVQVVRSRRSTVTFQWERGQKTLVVDWPHGAPRPDLRFE